MLVKAHPQPSGQYGETVCCAGIDDDTRELVRIYPVRYRQLPAEFRFNRFDLIEGELLRPKEDSRPESYKLREDSLSIVRRANQVNAQSKVQLWLPHVSASLTELEAEQKRTRKSLGIVNPDEGSVQFICKRAREASAEERDAANSIREQQALFESSVDPLPEPEWLFYYRFTSDGKSHTMQLHDWEAQAAYFSYRRRYGDEALDYLREQYENKIPRQELHLLMGNHSARPWQFMIIGLLRSRVPVSELGRQQGLFD